MYGYAASMLGGISNEEKVRIINLENKKKKKKKSQCLRKEGRAGLKKRRKKEICL